MGVHRGEDIRGLNEPPFPALPPSDTQTQVRAYRAPAEFERQECIAFGASSLVRKYPDVFVQLARAMKDRVRVVAVVNSEREETVARMLLVASDLGGEAVSITRNDVPSMWVRDWCPTSVYDESGHRFFVGSAIGNKPAVAAANPAKFASDYFGSPVAKMELNLEGGNLITDGRGLFLTTTTVFSANSSRGYDAETIGRLFKKYLAAWRWVYLPPLAGELTGHVDIFLTFVSPDTVVVGQYQPKRDSQNAERLDKIAETLAGIKNREGKNLNVVRIPMGFNRDGKFRSYTNVIYANGTLVVPQFPDTDADLDGEALALYSRLMPGWKIVGIDCSKLNDNNGALHCLSASIPPSLAPGFASVATLPAGAGAGAGH
jgi:agmatine/peptidylarginine deiminase